MEEAGGQGLGPPYSAVVLTFRITEDPIAGPYVRGRLAFADIDSTVDLSVWLDAVHAAYAEAPMQMLTEMNKQLVIKGAMIDPEEARKTWGTRPEHIAMAGKLGQGPGLESGAAGMAPETRASTPGFAPVSKRPLPRRPR